MWTILNILLIATPIFFLYKINDSFWSPKNMVFALLGFILIATTFITDNIKYKTFKNKFIGYFFILVIIHFVWFFWKPCILVTTEHKALWNIWNYIPTMNIILGIYMMQTLIEYTDNLSRWVNVSKILCYLAFFFSLYAIIQFCGIDQIFPSKFYWLDAKVSEHYRGEYFKNYRMITFFGNKMQTGMFLAMLSPLCLMFKNMRFKVFYAVIFITICINMSALSMIAFIAGLLVYLTMNKRFRLSFIIIALCIIGAIVVTFIDKNFWSFNSRFGIWKEIFFKSIDTSITGKGIGSFANRVFLDPVSKCYVMQAHNEFLQIFHDGGILLLGVVVCYLGDLARRIIMAKSTMLLIGYVSGLLAYLIICLGGFPLRLAPLALIGIVYLSSIEAQLQGG